MEKEREKNSFLDIKDSFTEMVLIWVKEIKKIKTKKAR